MSEEQIRLGQLGRSSFIGVKLRAISISRASFPGGNGLASTHPTKGKYKDCGREVGGLSGIKVFLFDLCLVMSDRMFLSLFSGTQLSRKKEALEDDVDRL